MMLLCTYFVAGTKSSWSQEGTFHRVFKATQPFPVDILWAAKWIQEQLEADDEGSVVFTQFNMIGNPQEVDDDFEV